MDLKESHGSTAGSEAGESSGSSLTQSPIPSSASTSTLSPVAAFGRRLSTFSLRPNKKHTKTQAPKNEFGLSTLFAPADRSTVIADFVFVHGLGGGSSTTWCIGQDTSAFWPKEWLPNDPDFNSVRIHSFGYNADWMTWTKNPLDVHAFGQSLVEELSSHPQIKDQDTSIVLVGHSMGGLVIKKTCILSKTNPEFSGLGNRLHSFFFLGTPHRGSDLAAVLSNILRISGIGRRPFVTGLERRSDLIRLLNDEFRLHYRGIHLHTFYETQPTPGVGIIVDSESATLRYAEERPQLLNAGHRGLAKFESPNDSNYRSLRNRLAATVQQIRDERQPCCVPRMLSEHGQEQKTMTADRQDQLEEIRVYLGVELNPEETLSSLDDARLEGSCSWITAKHTFRQWQTSDTWRYFWLQGAPASGKSVLASHVINSLKQNPTCFHFFKAGDKASSRLSSFLASMAYQMAKLNGNICQALFQLSQEGAPIDLRNHKTMWNSVFTGCIFNEKLSQPHFWVIDALDEASDGGPVGEYFLLFSKIDDSIPLKIFITSRPSRALDSLFARLHTVSELITVEDTLDDIRSYVEAHSVGLPVANELQRKHLVGDIVDKAGGSFLWAVLVVKQLQDVLTIEEIHNVLNEVPQEMTDLYLRNMKTMEGSRAKPLAKLIIMWAICVVHPLTVDQMRDALTLSSGATPALDLKTSLQSLSGQFLDVDKHSRIQFVHETARAFLTSKDLNSEFHTDLEEAHTQVAVACFKYLTSDNFTYNKQTGSAALNSVGKTSIAEYICLYFGEHLLHASSTSEELFNKVDIFFKTNVLSWIECVVRLRDLDCLVRMSRQLSNYLSRRSKQVSTMMVQDKLVSWLIDLPRIVTHFGANLIENPGIIHTLVPPFCPRNSAVFRQFGCREDGIKLVGSWQASWDDKICSLPYHDRGAYAIASLDQRFAVGLSDGKVKLYKSSTCEEIFSLEHGEPVVLIEVGPTSRFLAAAGFGHLTLWDLNRGTLLFKLSTETQALAIAFDEKDTVLTIASRGNRISHLEIPSGILTDTISWVDTYVEDKEHAIFPLAPSAVTISVEQQVMAVIYRSRPLQLWSLKMQRSIGACLRPGTHKHNGAGPEIQCVAFHPNAALQRLAVSYWDGILTVFNTATYKPVISITADVDQLAISPNGKTLAGGDLTGAIKVFDFETLQCIHKTSSQVNCISGLTFTSNSLRVVALRNQEASVWEPSVLINQDNDSHGSEPSKPKEPLINIADTSAERFGLDPSRTWITSLHCCEENSIAFCGRSDGGVDMCSLDDPGNTMRHLYRHCGAFTMVTYIDWAVKARVVISADTASCFRVMKVTTDSKHEWGAELLLEGRLEEGACIRQVLVHPQGTRVLISSAASDSLWCVETKKQIASIPASQRRSWKWFVRTTSQLVLFEDDAVRFYNWDDLSAISSSQDVAISVISAANSRPGSSEQQQQRIVNKDAITIASETDNLVFAQKMYPDEHHTTFAAISCPTTNISVLDLSRVGPPASKVKKGPTDPTEAMISRGGGPYRNVASLQDVDCIIGTVQRFHSPLLVFLTKQGWVCSVELSGSMLVDSFQKHFFIPTVWRTVNPDFMTKILRNQDVIFVLGDRVIVVKNGLDGGEYIPLENA